jgi:hypothetical protein
MTKKPYKLAKFLTVESRPGGTGRVGPHGADKELQFLDKLLWKFATALPDDCNPNSSLADHLGK